MLLAALIAHPQNGPASVPIKMMPAQVTKVKVTLTAAPPFGALPPDPNSVVTLLCADGAQDGPRVSIQTTVRNAVSLLLDTKADRLLVENDNGDVVGAFTANNVFTPALAKAVAQAGKTGKICAFGFDLGPAQQDAIRSGDLTGSLGQQPFLQGFWPVMQLYLQIDRGISAANLDTRAQLVTKDSIEKVGKRFEN